MGSLTSTWQSSSLTCVSPQDHQHPTVRPLTTNQSRFVLPSRSKMAKIGSIFLLVLVLVVIIGFVVGDTLQNGGRSKVRARKRKANVGPLSRREDGSVGPTEETGTEIPLTDLENLDEREVETTTEPTSTKRPPKPKKVNLRSQSPTDPNASTPGGCGECDISACKNIPETSCSTGLVLDRCSCCFVCGIGEGNRCYNASIPNLSHNTDDGICGTGLACILRSDLDPTEPREALCECRDRRLVCGNDNQTYNSDCKIREVSHSNPGLSVSSWGPCVSAPWISSPIENATVTEGDDVSLSCEVKGFPNAVIHWEYISSDNSAPTILPGDDSSVVVVVRGGPEQTMSTSWIQIIAVTSERRGTYYCVARNSEGVTRSAALVTIYKQGTLPIDNIDEN